MFGHFIYRRYVPDTLSETRCFFSEKVIVSVIVSKLYKHYDSTCVAKTIALDLIVNPLS